MKAVVLITSAAPSVINVGVSKNCLTAAYKSKAPRPSAELMVRMLAESRSMYCFVANTNQHQGENCRNA